MENLINVVYEVVEDYRSDEGRDYVKITPERIRTWIEQFEEHDRVFILTELENIFKKHYVSKEDAQDILKEMVEFLTKKYQYKSSIDFLRNTVFLNLQPEGKSQGSMLILLTDVLEEHFNFDYSDCGSNEKKHFIYLDDILCTGQTLLNDICEWCKERNENDVTYLKCIEDGASDLIFAYIFIHSKNYYKKKAEFGHKLSSSFKDRFIMCRAIEIDNNINPNSAMELVLPLKDHESELILNYENKIIAEVDNYAQQKGYRLSANEFYRPNGVPRVENFFTSPDNRKRFEHIITEKGIKILDSANSRISNMRALGYSLPSHKNFGFGTLCFT